ncbi:MAG: hypothetical protein GY737_22065 [Desulfobacteraceae bacterium]|nr:hypothetical protein [Desulfobacteraceae bacterium]
MNKKFLLISGLFIFILIVGLLIANPPKITIEKPLIDPPERPSLVPDKAFWVGGPDGGNFVYVMKSDSPEKNTYYAMIYNDYSGEIEYEGNLKYSGDRDISDSIDKPELFQGWDGERLFLSNDNYMSIVE